MSGKDDRWCILHRFASASTLKIAECLSEAGFRVWSPTIQITKRVGRSRKRETISVPLLAGIVFADFRQAWELVEFSRSQTLGYRVWDSEQRRMVAKGCPTFTVLREHDHIPSTSDRSLDPLRLVEQAGIPKAKRPTFNPGALVKHPASGFEGLVGRVERKKGRLVVVCFTDPARPDFTLAVDIEPHKLIAA